MLDVCIYYAEAGGNRTSIFYIKKTNMLIFNTYQFSWIVPTRTQAGSKAQKN